MGKSKSADDDNDYEDRFNLSGPCNLKAVEWSNKHHKRAVVASLVQGAYVMETDRQKWRHGQHALAPPWWESFDFHLREVLTDPADSSRFGAVFEYKNPVMLKHYDAPTYVVAFRGTLLQPGSVDAWLNIASFLDKLHGSSRFTVAFSTVIYLVRRAREAKVWLAGHSLGAALAMLVGKSMVWEGYPPLEAHLFNPPFLGNIKHMVLDGIVNRDVSNVIWYSWSVTRAGVAAAVVPGRSLLFDHKFLALSNWVPHVYVNDGDLISSGCIGYFEHRQLLKANGLEGAIATRSLRSLLDNDTATIDLVPSAHVHICYSLAPSITFEDHRLNRWWNFRVQPRSMSYKFP